MNYLRYGKNWVTISQGNETLGKLMRKKYSKLKFIDNHVIFMYLDLAKKCLLIEYEIY